MKMQWYYRWVCYLMGHQVPVIAGRLRTPEGDSIIVQCYYCSARWYEPLPNNQISTTQLKP